MNTSETFMKHQARGVEMVSNGLCELERTKGMCAATAAGQFGTGAFALVGMIPWHKTGGGGIEVNTPARLMHSAEATRHAWPAKRRLRFCRASFSEREGGSDVAQDDAVARVRLHCVHVLRAGEKGGGEDRRRG